MKQKISHLLFTLVLLFSNKDTTVELKGDIFKVTHKNEKILEEKLSIPLVLEDGEVWEKKGEYLTVTYLINYKKMNQKLTPFFFAEEKEIYIFERPISKEEISENIEEQYKLYLEKSTKGDQDAISLYTEGVNSKIDQDGIILLKESARRGFAPAMYFVGNRYFMSNQFDLSLQWFNLAYSRGHNRTCLQLALMYEKGEGVEKK